MKTGIILLSHGSRLPEAQITLRQIKEQIIQSGNYELVEGASLQFNQPDLPTVLCAMARCGMQRVVVVPIFIYQGMHMKRDIPAVLAAEQPRYPKMKIVLAKNIGADRKLAEIIMNRIQEVS